MYLPLAQFGLQLLTLNVPAPNALVCQLVQLTPEMYWLDGMQNGASYLAGLTSPLPEHSTRTVGCELAGMVGLADAGRATSTAAAAAPASPTAPAATSERVRVSLIGHSS